MRKKGGGGGAIVQLQPTEGGKEPGAGGRKLKEGESEEGPWGGLDPVIKLKFKWPKCAPPSLPSTALIQVNGYEYVKYVANYVITGISRDGEFLMPAYPLVLAPRLYQTMVTVRTSTVPDDGTLSVKTRNTFKQRSRKEFFSSTLGHCRCQKQLESNCCEAVER